MQIVRFIFFILISTLLLISCAKEKQVKSVIQEKNLELQVLEAYEEGLNSLKRGDVLFAAKKFNEAEVLFPQSEWAPKSALMAAYSYYSQDYYEDAILELQRFIKVYPFYKDLDYAYYLLGLCWYEQIVDEKKDLQTIIKAKEKFMFLIKNYPEFYKYFKETEFTWDRTGGDPIKQGNRNPLLYKNVGVDGVKTGYLAVERYSLASSMLNNDMSSFASYL